MTQEQIKVLEKAIETYGVRAQLDMFNEEAGEAIQALNKYKRDPHPSNWLNLSEELADLTITSYTVATIFKMHESIEVNIGDKIKRLGKRIEKADPISSNIEFDPVVMKNNGLTFQEYVICATIRKMQISPDRYFKRTGVFTNSISDKLGMSRSTVYRIIQSLIARDKIEKLDGSNNIRVNKELYVSLA